MVKNDLFPIYVIGSRIEKHNVRIGTASFLVLIYNHDNRAINQLYFALIRRRFNIIMGNLDLGEYTLSLIKSLVNLKGIRHIIIYGYSSKVMRPTDRSIYISEPNTYASKDLISYIIEQCSGVMIVSKDVQFGGSTDLIADLFKDEDEKPSLFTVYGNRRSLGNFISMINAIRNYERKRKKRSDSSNSSTKSAVT